MTAMDANIFAPRRIFADLLDFLFPPRCQVCGNNCSGDNIWLCPECFGALEIATTPVCVVCRQPSEEPKAICPHCHRRARLKWLYSLGGYAGAYANLIKSFKYNPKPGIAGLLAELIASNLAELPHLEEIDLLCPVPLHDRKQAARGFNQAALLAGEIAGRLQKSMEPEALLQVRKTCDQIGLDLEERFANVSGVFAVPSRVDIRGLNILLVDDVTTSGATLNEAARAIKAAGAASVAAVTVAVSYEEGIDFQAACRYLTEWPVDDG
jgi:ComF family protein